MPFIIVGLGNPGKEYENTRHNTGRMVLETFRRTHDFPDLEFDKKLNALVSKGSLLSPSKVKSQRSVVLLLPETFMNKSGNALKQIQDSRLRRGFGGQAGFKTQVKNKKKEITNLAVIHDDLDIPFGSYKISFNKSSGGHRGVESIIKALKTQAFVRVRVGIASSVAAVKKSQDESTVEKTILGKFTPDQLTILKKLSKRICDTLVCLVTEGREKAMSRQGSF